METEPVFTAADYWQWPDRYSLADGWWQGHGRAGQFPETMLPPLSLFILADGEPVAFLSCYQALGIGVAILDWVVTKPSLALAVARRALEFGQHAIREIIRPDGYGIVMAYTLPPIARTLKRSGWTDCGEKTHLLSRV